MSTSWSKVEHNQSTGTCGGFLVTDESGPATGNWIAGNLAKGNETDCGITLPSHNPNALSADGKRQPTEGGVYGNVVSGNIVVDNGLKGEGAGVLVGGSWPRDGLLRQPGRRQRDPRQQSGRRDHPQPHAEPGRERQRHRPQQDRDEQPQR